MNWIFSHLQIVIVAAAAVVYWINQQRTAAREEKKDEAAAGRRFTPAGNGAEDAERTRRIQEEIRRKIAERRGEAPVPSPASVPSERPLASPMMAPRPVAREIASDTRARLEAKLAEARARAEAAVQERQHRLAEQRTKAVEMDQRAVQRRETEAAAQAQNNSVQRLPSTTGVPSAPKSWPDELREASGLRRAIILREILGPPVGLR